MIKKLAIIALLCTVCTLAGCSDISTQCTTDGGVIVKRWIKEQNRSGRYTGMSIECLPISITTQEAWKMYPNSLKLEVYDISLLPPSSSNE